MYIGFSALAPDALYSNTGASDAVKVHNRGLAHIQNITIGVFIFTKSCRMPCSKSFADSIFCGLHHMQEYI